MNRSSRTKGLAAKYLALVASITMVLAGVAGVAIAGPASADQNSGNDYHKVWICHAVNGQGETKLGYNLIEIDQSAWDGSEVGQNSDHSHHDGDKEATFLGGDVTDEDNYSCGDSGQPECKSDEELVNDVCAPKCEEGEIRNADGNCVPDCKGDEELVDGECVNPCDQEVDSYLSRTGVKEDPCDDPCDSTVNLSGPRTLEDTPDCPSEPQATASLNCDGDWTVDVSGYDASDETGVRVYIDGEKVRQGYLNDGAYSADGTTELSESTSHTIEVKIDLDDGYVTVFSDVIECDAPVAPTVSATCSTLTIDVNDGDPEWFYIYQNDSQISYSYDEGTNTITAALDGSISKDVVVWYGESEEPLWSETIKACDTPPPPDFCTLNPGSVSCNPPATCANNPAACPPGETPPVTPQVVEAATTTAAPAAATIAAPQPAKKPAKKPVNVAAPGTVSAGVATVTAPSKATVPTSVPAGDGSQAPGLPLWAAALMLVGLLGAAASAKGLFARK